MNPFLPNYNNIGGKKLINIQQRNHILAILNIKPSLQIPIKRKRYYSARTKQKKHITIKKIIPPVFSKRKEESIQKNPFIHLKENIPENNFVSYQKEDDFEGFNAILDDEVQTEMDEKKIEKKNLNSFIDNLKEYASRFGKKLLRNSSNPQKNDKMDGNYISQPFEIKQIRTKNIHHPDKNLGQRESTMNLNKNIWEKSKIADPPFLYRLTPQSAQGLKTSLLTREFEIKALMNNLAEIERQAIKTQSSIRKDFRKEVMKKKFKTFFVSEYNLVKKNEEEKLKGKQKEKLEKKKASKSKKIMIKNLDRAQDYQKVFNQKKDQDFQISRE